MSKLHVVDPRNDLAIAGRILCEVDRVCAVLVVIHGAVGRGVARRTGADVGAATVNLVAELVVEVAMAFTLS